MNEPTLNQLRVWIPPQPEYHYTLSVDPSEGLPHGDDAVIEVFCVETGCQCAEWQGKTEPTELGELAYEMGEWYNFAYAACENNKDLTPQSKMLEMGYPNYHYVEIHGHKASPVPTLKPGWNTNRLTRYLMVNQGRAHIKDGSITVYSETFWEQAEIFARDRQGKYQAIPGGHDDVIMAVLINIQLWIVCHGRAIENEEPLRALDQGQPILPGENFGDLDEWDHQDPISREERLGNKALKQLEREQYTYPTTLDALI